MLHDMRNLLTASKVLGVSDDQIRSVVRDDLGAEVEVLIDRMDNLDNYMAITLNDVRADIRSEIRSEMSNLSERVNLGLNDLNDRMNNNRLELLAKYRQPNDVT